MSAAAARIQASPYRSPQGEGHSVRGGVRLEAVDKRYAVGGFALQGLDLSAMVADYLHSHGYQVSTAPSLGAGREMLARQAIRRGAKGARSPARPGCRPFR